MDTQTNTQDWSEGLRHWILALTGSDRAKWPWPWHLTSLVPSALNCKAKGRIKTAANYQNHLGDA